MDAFQIKDQVGLAQADGRLRHGGHAGFSWVLHHAQAALPGDFIQPPGAVRIGAGQQDSGQLPALSVGGRLHQHIDRWPRKMHLRLAAQGQRVV